MSSLGVNGGLHGIHLVLSLLLIWDQGIGLLSLVGRLLKLILALSALGAGIWPLIGRRNGLLWLS